MSNVVYGTMEDAGGWRFFGGTHPTDAKATEAIMKKQAANWLYAMKVVRIFRRPKAEVVDSWQSLPWGPTVPDSTRKP